MEASPFVYYFTILPNYDVATCSLIRVGGEILVCLFFFCFVAVISHPSVVHTLLRLLNTLKKQVEAHKGYEAQKESSKSPSCITTTPPPMQSILESVSPPSSVAPPSDRTLADSASNQNSSLKEHEIDNSTMDHLIDSTLDTFLERETLLDVLSKSI